VVKRLLTRIAYPGGLSARFGLPLAAARAISAPRRATSGCLGHIRANSQHNRFLGSRSQGPAAEIVEGFFFRRLRTEDGKRVGCLLVKSPPGLGKTREAIKWAIRYQAEQEGKDGTRLSLGDFNEAGVPAQTRASREGPRDARRASCSLPEKAW
jgi:hypothetical protein